MQEGEIDPEHLARQIGEGERPFGWKEAGALLEGKRRLLGAVRAARTALDAAAIEEKGADVPRLRDAYQAARERLQAFVDDVQKGKTEWSNTGRALQAGTELDTGDFAEVLAEAQRARGKPLTAGEEKQLKQLAEQGKAKDAEIARLEGQLRKDGRLALLRIYDVR